MSSWLYYASAGVVEPACLPETEGQRLWAGLRRHFHSVARLALPTCRYELPSDFNTLLLQYRRAGGGSCTARMYSDANDTLLSREGARCSGNSGPAANVG